MAFGTSGGRRYVAQPLLMYACHNDPGHRLLVASGLDCVRLADRHPWAVQAAGLRLLSGKNKFVRVLEDHGEVDLPYSTIFKLSASATARGISNSAGHLAQ